MRDYCERLGPIRDCHSAIPSLVLWMILDNGQSIRLGVDRQIRLTTFKGLNVQTYRFVFRVHNAFTHACQHRFCVTIQACDKADAIERSEMILDRLDAKYPMCRHVEDTLDLIMADGKADAPLKLRRVYA